MLRERGLTDCLLPYRIVPLDRAMVASGPAFTVRGRPEPSISPHESLLRWTEMLSAIPKGSVVVCQPQDSGRALMGELSAETLQFRGVRGFIVDGGCRDTSFIRKIGFPVFSSFHTPRDIVGAWVPEEFDAPISIGGVIVRSGDFVLGDCDGIVRIPAEMVEDIITESERVIATESLVRKAILGGIDPKEAYVRYGKF
nr:RraA family protein [Tsuneonella dongtanensis]